jgi:conjugal transfer ATP-binding protein TraC
LLKKFKQTKQANPTPEPQDLFMPERITEREDCLIINNIFLRTLVVDMLPEQVHFGWLASVSSIPGVTVSITIHPYTHEQASNRISRQQTILGSELIRAEKENNTRRIDVLNLKYHFYRELLKEVNLRRTNIVSLTATIAVAASTHDYLNKKCAKIQDILRATRLKTLYLKQVDGIKTLLPGVDSIDEYHDATIANAACLSPLISTNLSHPSGVYFGLNESGSPCFLDLFSGSPRLFGPHMFLLRCPERKNALRRPEDSRADMCGQVYQLCQPGTVSSIESPVPGLC